MELVEKISREREDCNVEIEINTFVVKGSVT